MSKKLNNYLSKKFIAVYDANDNFITTIEDIDNASKQFNIQKKELYRKLRDNSSINYNNQLVRLFLIDKGKDILT